MRFFIRFLLIFILAFGIYWKFKGFEPENQSINIPSDCLCKSKKTGKLYDFCYRLPEDVTQKGKKFSCEWLEKWEEIESSDNFKLINPRIEEIPEPVFVTAFNEPFLQNGLRLISAIRSLGLRTKIVLYDLGIENENLERIKKASCNVEIRSFNFSSYLFHVKNLKEYRWKPVVIAETLRDFGAIWYLDSSLIFEKSDVSHVYKLVECQRNVTHRPPMLSDDQRDVRERREKHEDGWDHDVWNRNIKECRKVPFLMHGFTGHGIWSVTNPAVYTYFPTNFTQIKKKKAKMYDANLIYAVNTYETTMEIVKWTYLCALEEECMGPKGSSLGCNFGKDRFEEYAGCHRYDQSIMNLLLANRYWYDRRYYVSEIVDFFKISRTSTNFKEQLGCL